uniref:Triadin n=1 Tax=Meleagris gallopavo TaxID=9103 RepID=G1NKR6_MELGA
MAEVTAEGRMSTTTTITDGKNGSVPSSMRMGKKSVTEDLVTTFSSPAAWLLVVALIVTWSAVAIVMFDLVDYKAFAEIHKEKTERYEKRTTPKVIHREKPQKQERNERKEHLKGMYLALDLFFFLTKSQNCQIC